MTEVSTATQAWNDLTLPFDEVMRRAWRWTGLLAAVTLIPFMLVWGGPAWPSGVGWLALVGRGVLYTVAALAVYAVSAVVHEGLHALAVVTVGRVPWRAIEFGVRWREGVAYVHAGRPMTVRAYRVVLALPGFVQGVLPAAAGLLLGYGWVLIYGFVMLASAACDLIMLRLMHPLPAHLLVRDHPDKVGCQVLCQ
jgi:hypothetical protein